MEHVTEYYKRTRGLKEDTVPARVDEPEESNKSDNDNKEEDERDGEEKEEEEQSNNKQDDKNYDKCEQKKEVTGDEQPNRL